MQCVALASPWLAFACKCTAAGGCLASAECEVVVRERHHRAAGKFPLKAKNNGLTEVMCCQFWSWQRYGVDNQFLLISTAACSFKYKIHDHMTREPSQRHSNAHDANASSPALTIATCPSVPQHLSRFSYRTICQDQLSDKQAGCLLRSRPRLGSVLLMQVRTLACLG
ncbi:hypothetical protein BD289DRAFT_139797 [Coniella lustricola]|uniref:Secreted protein n=1 Tax=Coniella lustricola TaxID=2025994 RepID=A0A2T3AF37_9PEZI|nr:hypothetical protein BD289DRAFT_139797 [Coniella lustricola]